VTRGRIRNELEDRRSEQEAALGMLGNAVIYGRLVQDRVKAAQIAGSVSFLDMALEDLAQMERLIHQVQTWISEDGISR
jgi:hypothetical protein